MAERVKSPREIRKVPIDLDALVPDGATLTGVDAFAARLVSASTTLAASISPEDSSIQLNADPKKGAILIVDPGSSTAEETFKVSAVSGLGPYVCTVTPTAERSHSGSTVNYYPGVNATFLVDDTPTLTDAIANVVVQQGADGNSYRVSVIGTTDAGELVEDELDIDVVEFATTSTVVKQPTETRDIAVDFVDWVAAFATSLSSAIGFVSRQETVSGEVATPGASAGATSLPLSVHPGVGAILTVNNAGGNREKLLVSAVGAGPPYACTVSPLQFDHAQAEPVSIAPGVTTRVLVSATATVSGTEAIFRARRGAAGQLYTFVILATLADGQVVQKTAQLTVSEL